MDRRLLWERLEAHPMSAWRSTAEPARPGFSGAGRLLWCGIGGSLLPSDALVAALSNPHAQPRWMPLASPEPQSMVLDPADQVVLASKSGRTLELWTWIGRLRAMKGWGRFRHAPLVITQDDANPLAAWAREEGWTILPIPERVGGRYSAFTAIGTLPLQWMGLDASAYLKGAASVVSEVERGEGQWARRVWGTVEAWVQAYLRGIDHWVLLPYANHLEVTGAWWVQLVAESLGKRSADGIRRGIIPIRAIGPQDQHAQLQRWLDGPRNVGVMLVTVGDGQGEEVSSQPTQCPFPGLAGLSGARILRAQAEGTRETLEAADVPVLHWNLKTLDEQEMGAFLMAWQLIVALVGIALEVDPFDQPAVEAGKRKTMEMLGMS